jgi:hypothetical protein
MTRQERTIAIAVLIPLLYGLQIYFTQGSFILPFPLIELIFFIVAVVFGIQLYKFRFLESVFSLAFAFFQLLSSEVFWSFILQQETLTELADGPLLGLASILSYTLLVIWGGISLIRPTDKARSSVFIPFLALISAGLIFRSEPLIILSALVPFIAHFKYKELAPYHLLWLLFALLETMRLAMLAWVH